MTNEHAYDEFSQQKGNIVFAEHIYMEQLQHITTKVAPYNHRENEVITAKQLSDIQTIKREANRKFYANHPKPKSSKKAKNKRAKLTTLKAA